jgi:hypothetical protein
VETGSKTIVDSSRDTVDSAVKARDLIDPEVRVRRRHAAMLGASGLVVAAAFLLEVLPDGERVAVSGLGRWPLPHSCLTRVWFDQRCPLCGLTRSIVHLAHGDGLASVKAHRIGWVLALAIVAQIPYRILALRRLDRPPMDLGLAKTFGLFLIVLLVGNWLYDLLR